MEARTRGPAAGGAGKVTQVDHELPAEATNCEGGGLGEESCKQHHRNRYAYENGKGRVQKCNGVVGHGVVDVRCEGEVHGRQEAELTDARLRHDETAS